MSVSLCKYLPVSILKDIVEEKILGQGTYGRVFQANVRGKKYAIKEQIILDEINCLQSQDLVELDAMQRFRGCRTLMSAEGLCIQDNKLLIFMPIMQMNLCEYSRTVNRNTRIRNLKKVFIDSLTGLAVLNSVNMAHFDIKPQNILLNLDSRNNVILIKLSDFGLAQYHFGSNENKQLRYTLYYRPPEHLFNLSDSIEKEKKIPIRNAIASDVWALGVTLMDYISADYFLASKDETELINKIKTLSKRNGGRYIEIVNNLPNEIGRWIQMMLQIDPNMRPRPEEILKYYGATGLLQSELSKMPNPGEITRRVKLQALQKAWDYLKSWVTEEKLNFLTVLGVMEMFTRIVDLSTYDKLGDYFDAIIYLAATYLEQKYLTENFMNKPNLCSDVLEVYQLLNFEVFDNNLTIVYRRLYEKYRSGNAVLNFLLITDLDMSVWNNPIQFWFI